MAIRDLTPWWRGGDDRGQSLVNPLAEFRREMDRVFDSFFGGDVGPLLGERRPDSPMVPRVDVSETEKEIEVKADMPGLEEKDIDVSLSNGNLTIKGERKAEREEKNKEYHRIERSYGLYQRVIALPCEVDEGKVSADFAKGVLTVTLPKSPKAQAKSKKIEVKPGKGK